VDALGELVVDPGVGGHLAAAVAARPFLGCGEQLSADSLPAPAGVDVLALDEADSAGRIAAVGVGAQADFDKSDELRIGCLGDQIYDRQWETSAAFENRQQLARMFVCR
jgi:hypothetical protein